MTDTAARESAGRQFSLGDRYTTISGEILATGVQALARLPLDQMRADRRAGLDTAAFISGYQGSPLGGYDRELQSQRALLDELRIVHRPALNEELGATAVTGQPAVGDVRLAPLRRRARHLVRQVARGRPGRRRHPPRQLRRHGPPRRRARARRRRPGVQVVHAALPLRGDPGRPRPRGALPGHRAGHPRPRPARRRAVPGQRPVDRDEDRHLRGRRLGDGRGRPRAHPSRRARRSRSDGQPWTPTLTGNIMRADAWKPRCVGPRGDGPARTSWRTASTGSSSTSPQPWLGIVAGGHACEQVLEALGHAGPRRGRRCATSACGC